LRLSDAAKFAIRLPTMAKAIPQRIPPLTWRRPSLLWTPVALALAIGWPAALFYSEPGLQRLALITGAAVFALALISLGVSWALGRAPRARRIVVLHVVVAGAITALAAPFVLTELLAAVADYESAGAVANFTLAMSLALASLALVLGLPIALVSGILFAWVALARPHVAAEALLDDAPFRHDVQPFR
jgi:hypothetical protein